MTRADGGLSKFYTCTVYIRMPYIGGVLKFFKYMRKANPYIE